MVLVILARGFVLAIAIEFPLSAIRTMAGVLPRIVQSALEEIDFAFLIIPTS